MKLLYIAAILALPAVTLAQSDFLPKAVKLLVKLADAGDDQCDDYEFNIVPGCGKGRLGEIADRYFDEKDAAGDPAFSEEDCSAIPPEYNTPITILTGLNTNNRCNALLSIKCPEGKSISLIPQVFDLLSCVLSPTTSGLAALNTLESALEQLDGEGTQLVLMAVLLLVQALLNLLAASICSLDTNELIASVPGLTFEILLALLGGLANGNTLAPVMVGTAILLLAVAPLIWGAFAALGNSNLQTGALQGLVSELLSVLAPILTAPVQACTEFGKGPITGIVGALNNALTVLTRNDEVGAKTLGIALTAINTGLKPLGIAITFSTKGLSVVTANLGKVVGFLGGDI